MTERAPGRRYAGRDPSQRRDDRRRRLLDSALDLFATAGYNATTVNDVCRAAGVAPVHFYDLFDGREGLLRAVYDEVVATSQLAVLEAVTGAPLDAVERSRAGLVAFCRSLLSDPRRARIQCIEVVGVSAAMEAHRREVIHAYVALLFAQLDEIRSSRPPAATGADASAAGAAGAPVAIDPAAGRVLATALVGGVNEAMIDWLLAEEPPPIDVLEASLADLFAAVATALD